jgi:ketol-acid reductoisomerase
MERECRIFFEKDIPSPGFKSLTAAVIGYGNQGRAQALNLRDSGVPVLVGNIRDAYAERAAADGFSVLSIEEATKAADLLLLLVPDETMPDMFSSRIAPHLKAGQLINFASGYNIAFGMIEVPDSVDVTFIAPRMIGVGVRERYLSGEGYFSFVGVHQDAGGKALNKMLFLAGALGTLKKGAVELTMKQEAVLDLFNEQAFGPAFGRVLLTAVDVLVKNGFPPEAVLTEMYMSEEMSYTYKKMAQFGLVQQTNFHSQTSQYGAMSRGIRYMKLGLEERMQKSLDEIESGDFAREWSSPFAKLKLKIIRFFAMRQKINKLEKKVRERFCMKNYDIYREPVDIEELLKTPEIQNELDDWKDWAEF